MTYWAKITKLNQFPLISQHSDRMFKNEKQVVNVGIEKQCSFSH